MNLKKNAVMYSAMVGLAVFGVIGWSLAFSRGQANAEDSGTVDSDTVEQLYETVFHRPADAGGLAFNRGRKLGDILRDFRGSDEMRYYGALFKSVKSYEEAQRAPGTLSDTDKQAHLDLIDSALSSLLAWVGTLPDQEPCKGTISAEVAQAAVKEAHDRLTAAGKASSEQGLLNAMRRIGPPEGITMHNRCIRPSPSISPVVSLSPIPSATMMH